MTIDGDPSVTTDCWCLLSRNAAQNIPDSVFTPIIWGVEILDPDNWHSNSVNPERITPQWTPSATTVTANGPLFIVTLQARFVSNNTGRRRAWIRRGSDNLIVAQQNLDGASGILNLANRVQLARGDYVVAEVFQDTGGPLALDVTQTFFSLGLGC